MVLQSKMKPEVKSKSRKVTSASPPSFDWPLAFEAEKFLQTHLERFLGANSFARELAGRMREETGTDFFEWVDHLTLEPSQEPGLREHGFVIDDNAETERGESALHHPQATLPRVLLRNGPTTVALRPESVADFVARQNLGGKIEGAPWAHYRRALIAEENRTRLEAVERHGWQGFAVKKGKSNEAEAVLRARELWRTRRRHFTNDAKGFTAANTILTESIRLVGRDRSCEMFFAEERAYWESRNRAARVQKLRQDRLGLGWGNHDHHTFRCSRAHFVDLNEFLLRLGFEKRERYYAGAEAGWGAQISEQPAAGIVVFADVDLMPEETQIDFSVKRLPPAPKLGTVGLWVGLHGESFLEAGMHHLEARFDFARLRDQLAAEGVKTMNPFSDFEFLRQAFTEGERWPVSRERAERLAAAKWITSEQCEKFVKEGALGSHLENLQRHGGFKGFNQKSVSAVIAATDPRRNHFERAA